MGTPEFAVPTLQALVKHHEVVAVVTQPDKRKGRGKAFQYTEVKEEALKHDIPVYQPVKVKDETMVEILTELNPDVIVVVAFGQLLPESILNLPKYGCINVHASLLPKYRGAAPIQWAVINREEESGVTTMLMEKGLDTGDMLKSAKLTLDKKETGGSLHDKLSTLGADLLIETLKDVEAGNITPVKQDDSLSCYAKMLDKSLGNINWSQKATEIEGLIRGLNPWPSAYTTFGNKTIKIWDADVVEEPGKGEAGEIYKVTKDAIFVQTGEGALALKEVQLEGKKRMSVSAFLLGNQVKVSDCFGK